VAVNGHWKIEPKIFGPTGDLIWRKNKSMNQQSFSIYSRIASIFYQKSDQPLSAEANKSDRPEKIWGMQSDKKAVTLGDSAKGFVLAFWSQCFILVGSDLFAVRNVTFVGLQGCREFSRSVFRKRAKIRKWFLVQSGARQCATKIDKTSKNSSSHLGTAEEEADHTRHIKKGEWMATLPKILNDQIHWF
jgi:hypothetical protein